MEYLGHILKREYDLRQFRWFSKMWFRKYPANRQYNCLICGLYIISRSFNGEFYCLDNEEYDFIKCKLTCNEVIIKNLLE